MKPLLNDKQEAFCVEYIRHSDKHDAGIRAYLKTHDPNADIEIADVRAANLLRNRNIQIRLRELSGKEPSASDFGILQVLKNWIDIATANPNDLVQYRRYCCRYCWGVNHMYQWIELEYAIECAKALDRGRVAPGCEGGFNFIASRVAHPECPQCGGIGEGMMFVQDTRELTGKALALYAGVRKKGDNVEIVLRNQDAALENIAKYLGMFKNKLDGTGDGRQTTAIPKLSDVTIDPVQASKIYQDIMG